MRQKYQKGKSKQDVRVIWRMKTTTIGRRISRPRENERISSRGDVTYRWANHETRNERQPPAMCIVDRRNEE